ncbi:MAG: Ca-activated chloride channel family protein [Rhodothermales bacterium]|jgi:Ca-activated chloride channel family protein
MKTLLRSLSASLIAAVIFVGCAGQKELQEQETAQTRQIQQPPALPAGALGMTADYAQAMSGKTGRSAFGNPNWNTEDYALIEENGFQAVTDHPLSTFSIDVDAASYSNVRRFIRDGQLPPKDAVRIEELVNYFSYNYPEPGNEHPFSTVLEVGRAPWNANHQLLHVGLKGESIDLVGRPASNLVFLLDVSGSMNSPDKLPLLKKAFRMLVSELGEGDRVSIVVYAGAAGLVLPPTAGDNAEEIIEALSRLQAGGSTAGTAGIQLAYQTAGENFIPGGINRVILATDGDFNVGASSDAELIRMIESRREEGTFLTVLGFGTGNLKDNKMEQIADHGNGNYYYIDSELEARKVLVSELGGTLHTIAKDVKLQIEFNPAMVESYRLIGYENRLLVSKDFNDDKKDAGDLGAGHTVTALYEIVPVGASTSTAGSIDDLRYQTTTTTAAAGSGEILTLKLRYKEPDGDESQLIEHTLVPDADAQISGDFAFSAAVASFGMILRDSEHMGASNLAHVLKLARLGRGTDRHGYRADFISMAEDYRRVTEALNSPTDD